MTGTLLVFISGELKRTVLIIFHTVVLVMVLGDKLLSLDILFDFILYVPSTIFQLCRDGSSWVEPVLS